MMARGGLGAASLAWWRVAGRLWSHGNTQREAIVTVVEGRMRSFEAAERARDPERLIAHFASVPEFHFSHDGRHATYALMSGSVRSALPAVRSLEVAYADVQVSVLSAEYALVSATFPRETVIASTGAASQSQGAELTRNSARQGVSNDGSIVYALPEVGNNVGTIAPKHREKRRSRDDQKAGRINMRALRREAVGRHEYRYGDCAMATYGSPLARELVAHPEPAKAARSQAWRTSDAPRAAGCCEV
jgi:hypothetical protein